MKDPAGLSVFGLVVMYSGFFGFIGCALLFIFKGFQEDGKPLIRSAVLYFFLTLFFFSVWIAGLMLL